MLYRTRLLCLGTAIASLLGSTSLMAQTRPPMLSETLKRQVIATMHRDLGGSVTEFKITQVETATWEDCVGNTNPTPNCRIERQSGHRVRVSGRGEIWTYYVTSPRSPGMSPVEPPTPAIVLDGPASVSPRVRQALSKALGLDPKLPLQILAARPFGLIQNCGATSVTKPCDVQPKPYWQVLVDQGRRPMTIDLQGRVLPPSNLKAFLPRNLAGFPEPFAQAVLQDVVDRNLGMMAANLRVESIKPVTWAMCDSGGKPAPGPGPSRPMMGICPVGTTSGWQMMTRSGPVRWVHYVTPWPLTAWLGTLSHHVPPDGPQSVPKSVADAVIQDLAKREKRPVNNYRLHWAEPAFLDGCLSTFSESKGPSPLLSCRQVLQSGWQVQVMGPGGTGGMQKLSTYSANLTGTAVRFVGVTNWAPPPMAGPPMGRP